MQPKMIFIAWTAHNRRSQLLAQTLEMPLFLIHTLQRRYFLAPLRYLLQTFRTLVVLWRERPEVTFVQNPPILPALLVYGYSLLTGAAYVIDSHTGALLAPWWRWTLPLHAFLSRRARTTLVTNEYLAGLVRKWGAAVDVLADIPADFPSGTPFPVTGAFAVAVINTFSPDEPIAVVLEAAATLPEVTFYITGDPIRAKASYLTNPPPNVHFTGFLPDDAYIGLLRSVQAVVVLTTDNHTMQRGACEALWLGQPILTSDWPLLRSYFAKGTVYVTNTSSGIQDGIQRLRATLPQLQAEMAALQQVRRAAWESDYRALRKIIEPGQSTAPVVSMPKEAR